ncbi:MAG: nucleotide pyrophosphohydrolase [Clostridia bacterium]|nr:nucleotide pyrophosphohydrolase [Clostridia bacterium]
MLDLAEMQELQKALQEKYFDKWGGLPPQKAREKLLWMIAEAGEAAQDIKHHGDKRILEDPEARTHFAEEMCDVLMYLNDVLLCYGITPDEVEAIYRKKHDRNMNRW